MLRRASAKRSEWLARRHRQARPVGAILVLAGAVTGYLAVTEPLAGADDRDRGVRIAFRAANTSFFYGGEMSDPAPGDRIAYTYEARRGGVKVGSGAGTCINASPGLTNCSNTLTLDGRGRIVFGGVEEITETVEPLPTVVPVFGGTGEFASCDGVVTLTPVPGTDPLQHEIVIRLC
jgi:hypothetical protein